MTIRCLSGLYVGFLFCQASMKKGEAGSMPVSDYNVWLWSLSWVRKKWKHLGVGQWESGRNKALDILAIVHPGGIRGWKIKGN